ncbi:MAG: ParB/RepB/Spo0J family partition protein [Parcubacteria group bacterium]|nr:ParB/RepB/Spo0J family partition protein [Parcubacteria group bacterium]MCR4342991.1 ParB/RepB/Spo0J family partition protein [Patescibacteria group bacterium]
MSNLHSNSIFWIEVDKINPNPYQPRREFDEEKLGDLAESIRQYGILQPLVVTRKEFETDTGIRVEYELLAGERRLRASKKAGLFQVPVIIRNDESSKVKLEIAIIENLQREDLNPIEKARAFKRLVDEFKLKHHEVAAKVSKSREFVSNSIRILALPEIILMGLSEGKINEGHTRPLLMLTDRPDDQMTLFEEIIVRKMTVREAESIARGIARERVRKQDIPIDPETQNIENKLSDELGTRVQLERIGEKGKIVINFFSMEEFEALLLKLGNKEPSNTNTDNYGALYSESNNRDNNPSGNLNNIEDFPTALSQSVDTDNDSALDNFTI